MAERIEMTAGDYRAEILPETGGALGAFAWRHPAHGWMDLMRPAPTGDQALKVGDTASYPLIPFANRLRDSRFTFRGRTVQFPQGPIGKHYLHGTAWLRPWQVASAMPQSVRLTQRQEPDIWPYAFETSQDFMLGANGLTIRLAAVNRSSEPMPFGFGLHPYFPRTPLTRVDAEVSGWWETDADVLPTQLVGVPAGADPRQGLMVSSIVCDNGFTGWTGSAAITWPERATRLTMTAPAEFGVLFLYVPRAVAGEEPFFCLEPVSNIIDAFNLAAAGRTDTGIIVLQPGAGISADITFRADATA